MALEAGSVMHEVYAALRIMQLGEYQELTKHARVTAERIFGFKRWMDMLDLCDSHASLHDRYLQMVTATLRTSGFVDDPKDDTRTVANMEMAGIYYADEQIKKFDNWPIWVADTKDAKAPVGIEQVFDVTLVYSDGRKIRYVGTIDGLVYNVPSAKYFLDENKTASRIDRGWRDSFEVRHQPTGYVAASTTVFGFLIENVRVTGNKIKPTNKGEDVYPLEVHRKPVDILHWGSWVRHTVEVYERYKDNYEVAPRYTHSCNRYFRPCALIPFCADTPEGRRIQWSEMVAADPSPSEQAVS